MTQEPLSPSRDAQARGRAGPGPVPKLKAGWRALRAALLASSIVAWFLLVRRFGEGDVYAVLGPYACLVIALCLALHPGSLKRWFRADRKAVGIGLAVGVAMTVLTYPVFQLSAALFPSLERSVQDLYQGAGSTTLARALVWTVAAVVAEELMFRAAWPEALAEWVSARNAYAISLATYAGAQLGTGSFIVMLMAVVCGAIWTVQRHYTGSVLSPLISHLIWTPTVILLHPVI